MLEFHFGTYTPQVDEQFKTATPWKDVFGTDSMTLIGLHADYEVWKGHGTLAIGGGAAYGWISGGALTTDATTTTKDSVGFNIVPLQANVIYRWDWAAVEHGVPFVPYVKAGLVATIWWATDAGDSIAKTDDLEGVSRTGQGVTFGWQVGGGIQFLLDVLAPGTASEFDEESGVNNSFIFAEFMHSDVNDFGSSTSINLGDDALSFGLMFEF